MTLTPTARLVILALRASDTELTVIELSNLTGAKPKFMLRLVKRMAEAGHIVRHRINRLSHYSLPTSDTTLTPAA